MIRLLLLAAAIAASGCRIGPPKFDEVVNEFVYTTLSFSPVTATRSGYYRHAGTPLGEQIDDMSEAAMNRRRAFYQRFRKAVDGTKVERLLPEDRADYDVIQFAITNALTELDSIQTYKHNPVIYSRLAGEALRSAMDVTDGPPELRFFHVIRRMEAFPKLFDHARKNLADSPPFRIPEAQAENGRTRELLAKILPPQVPRDIRVRFDSVSQTATKALDDFDTYLTQALIQHPADWRLGNEKYAKLIPFPEAVLADTEAVLRVIDAQIHESAKVKKPPEAPAVDPAAAIVAELRNFVRVRVLLPLPETAREAADRPGEDAYAARLRLIADTMPGAGVLRAFSEKIEPHGRRRLRQLHGAQSTRDGWGEYAVQALIEEGYRAGDVGFRLAYFQRVSRMAAEAATDIRLHSTGLTEEAARELVTPEALAEIQREPGKLAGRFAGWMGMLRLRDGYRQARGRAFVLNEFHERVLKAGPLPAPAMAQLLTGQPLPPGRDAVSLLPPPLPADN